MPLVATATTVGLVVLDATRDRAVLVNDEPPGTGHGTDVTA
jgi:hypothetical protein